MLTTNRQPFEKPPMPLWAHILIGVAGGIVTARIVLYVLWWIQLRIVFAGLKNALGH